MSLNNTRIASGTVPPKGRLEGDFAFAPLTRTIPGTVRKYVNDEGVYVEDAQEPEVKGEVLVFTLAGSSSGTMFVAVEAGGDLYWVPVITRSGVIDSRTGKQWNPAALL